jgi:hypothetical protein
MGVIRHHTIIVTSWDDERLGKCLSEAHEKAREIFGDAHVSSVLYGINGYGSFFIPPDGSKEGWIPSDKGDEHRAQFVSWMKQQRYEDGSSRLQWVEVSFGGDRDGGPAHVVGDVYDYLREEEEEENPWEHC